MSKLNRLEVFFTLSILGSMLLSSCIGNKEGGKSGIMAGEVDGISYFVYGSGFDENVVPLIVDGLPGPDSIESNLEGSIWSGWAWGDSNKEK